MFCNGQNFIILFSNEEIQQAEVIIQLPVRVCPYWMYTIWPIFIEILWSSKWRNFNNLSSSALIAK